MLRLLALHFHAMTMQIFCIFSVFACVMIGLVIRVGCSLKNCAMFCKLNNLMYWGISHGTNSL